MILFSSFIVWAVHDGCRHISDIYRKKGASKLHRQYKVFIHKDMLNQPLEDQRKRLDDLQRVILSELSGSI